MSLAGLLKDSPALWIITGVLVCIFWNCLRAFFLSSRPTSDTHPVFRDEFPSNALHVGSASLEKIPETLLQQLKSGEMKPLPSRALTKKEMSTYTGSKAGIDQDNPIYLAVRGLVYDVSSAQGFYGPQGPYAAFAGHDATIALAKNNVEAVIGPDDKYVGVESLADHEVTCLESWEKKLQRKYPIIGYLND